MTQYCSEHVSGAKTQLLTSSSQAVARMPSRSALYCMTLTLRRSLPNLPSRVYHLRKRRLMSISARIAALLCESHSRISLPRRRTSLSEVSRRCTSSLSCVWANGVISGGGADGSLGLTPADSGPLLSFLNRRRRRPRPPDPLPLLSLVKLTVDVDFPITLVMTSLRRLASSMFSASARAPSAAARMEK